MAIYFAGYLSPIRNKLGNAVGRKWRTLDVLSAYNGRPRNPRTVAQQVQREHFKIASQLALIFAPVIEMGYKATCEGTPLPPRAYFMRKNWGVITMNDDPVSGTIDATAIEFSQGSLLGVDVSGQISTATPLTVAQTLVSNAGVGNALATDEVYMFVYDKEAGAGIISDKKYRSDESVEIIVPATWNGHRVCAYLITVGAAGTANEGKVSNSLCVGTGTIS